MPETVSSERRNAVADLLTEFCWRVDTARGDTVAELFTEEATVDTPHFNLRGKADIHAWFAGRAGKRLSRHCWTNLRITPQGADRYRVETNMMTTAGPVPAPASGGMIVIGSGIDEVDFASGTPLFTSRTLEILFEGVIAAPEKPA